VTTIQVFNKSRVDTETGELQEQRLQHREEAEKFYLIELGSFVMARGS
jgi:hypothetical protein